MDDFKRAMLSLTRRKGKTAILFIVIFILGNVIAGSIAINQATKKSEQQLKAQMGSVASISKDYQKLISDNFDFMTDTVPNMDEATIQEIGARPEVKTFDYSITDAIVGKDIDRVVVDKDENAGVMVTTDLEGTYFVLNGVNDPKVMEIEEGKSKLIEGRVFTEAEVQKKEAKAIVSKDFAEKNNLHVGDSFMTKRDLLDPTDPVFSAGVMSSNDMPAAIATQEIPLEIIGIFEPKMENQNKKDATGMAAFMNEEKANSFYVPNGFVTDLIAWDIAQTKELRPEADVSGYEEPRFTPTYLLKSPDDLKSFEDAVKPMIPAEYKLETTSDTYRQIAGPLESLKSMSNMTLIVSVVAGLAIIGLIMMLFLRDRKHEMGIYLSLGAPKISVITQIVLEAMLIGILAITVSLGTGNLVARSVSDTMIKNQQLQALENQDGNGMMFSIGGPSISSYGEDVTEEEAIEAYNVTLSPQYIITFYIVGLGTILISTLIPILYFMRLNPKQIML